MVASLAELEERVAALETASGGLVRGWAAAARVLGICTQTLKKRAKTDAHFPPPLRTKTFTRGDRLKHLICPEWQKMDLIKYKHHV